MNSATLLLIILVSTVLLRGLGCTPAPNPEALDQLGAVDLSIKDQPFHLWIADEFAEQANGLMFVNTERLAPLPDGRERGMIFIFDYEHELSFWMKNTIIPLDIAYLDSSGKVVKTYTMAALDDRAGQYSSIKPARYAIEVNAGVWQRIELKPGDTIALPDSVRKPSP